MAKQPKPESFKSSPDDPLAEEHAAVSAWVEEALASLGRHRYYEDADLKALPSGRRLLDGKPEPSRRYVLAAVEQADHWNRQAQRIRSRAEGESGRANVHRQQDWGPVWGRRRQAVAVIAALLRRNLPFEKDDLIAILRWCGHEEQLSPLTMPIGAIVRALQRYASGTPIDPELRDAMKPFAANL